MTPAIQPGPQVLLLSARTAEALQQSRSALAAELSGPDEVSLPDVAYTLARRRKENVRMAAVVNDRQDAAAVLGAPEHDNVFVGESASERSGSDSGRVVFLFPGQGAQHIGMARGLYEVRASVRRALRSVRRRRFARSWISTCARRSSTAPHATWSAPTAPNPRCSRWNTRWRS